MSNSSLIHPNSSLLNLDVRTYQEAGSTAFFQASPRFGHTNNIAVVFSGETDETADYISGLLFIGLIILSLFVLWWLLVLIFKCCGRNRCGFLSGQPVNANAAGCCSTVWNVRFVFVVAGGLVILFSMVLWAVGFQRFNSTSEYLYDSVEHVGSIINQSLVVTNDLLLFGNETIEVRDSLLEVLSGRNLCARTTDAAVSAVQQEIGRSGDTSLNQLNGLGNFAGDDIRDVQDALLEAQVVFGRVREFADDMQQTDVIYGIAYGCVFSFLSLLLMGSTLLAYCEDSSSLGAGGQAFRRCCTSWLVLPVFFLWTIVAILGCTIGPVIATANADFCVGTEGTPSSTILEILQEQGYTTASAFYNGCKFYIDQCTQPEIDPFQDLHRYYGQLSQAKDSLQELIGYIASLGDDSRIATYCGDDFPTFMDNLSSMISSLLVLETSVVSLLTLFSCDNIVPIYTDTVYEGLCYNSISGLFWIFCSFLLSSVMATIMVTLRSAYSNVVVPSDNYGEGDFDNKEVNAEAYEKAHQQQYGEEVEKPFVDEKPVDSMDSGGQEHAAAIQQPF